MVARSDRERQRGDWSSITISVSGIVGSGKTTVATHVVDWFGRQGVQAEQRRFQSLPCFRLLSPRSVPTAGRAPKQPRWRGYRPRALTLRELIGYVARILAFRLYRSWGANKRVQVFNRYFYDNLVHYAMATRRERIYARILDWLLPRPDVAFLLLAAPETIEARRSQYAAEYLFHVAEAYDKLRRRFPELVPISTDPGESTLERVEATLTAQLARS